MTTQQAIFALLSALLPVVGIVLPGIFKQDKLTEQANGLIATSVIVVIAALQAWSEGKINLINPWLDFGIVLTGISALLAGPFKSTDSYIQSTIGFGSKQPLPAPVTPAQTQTIDLINSIVTALGQHTQAFAALLPFIQSLVTSQQPAQTASTATAQPVHGPSNVSTATTAQPSQDGAQTAIPAFTATSEIPVVKAPTATTATA